jgi:chloramphenicol-sensitive protein RarD
MTDATLPLTPDEIERRNGFLAAASAYLIWGFLPLYIKFLGFADAREVLGSRIIFCIPAALLAVVLMSGGWRVALRQIGEALRPRMLAILFASAAFIFVNWGLYVWLVLQGRVIESSLAYFLAPLVAVGVGVAFFGEKITLPQTIALVLAFVGVVVQGVALGAPPWMALALCGTWSVYAVIRKRVNVPAAVGLLIETIAIAPVALGLMYWAAQDVGLQFNTSWTHAILLAVAGPLTAVPLVMFTFGARRVSFTTLGLLQFLAPSIQFATGIAFGENFTFLRGVSFALIWAGLGFFAWDVLRRGRESAKLSA